MKTYFTDKKELFDIVRKAIFDNPEFFPLSRHLPKDELGKMIIKKYVGLSKIVDEEYKKYKLLHQHITLYSNTNESYISLCLATLSIILLNYSEKHMNNTEIQKYKYFIRTLI